MLKSAMCVLGEALSSDVFSVSKIKLHQRYQPHFLTCYSLAKKSAIRSLELATLISKALTYMYERCTYDFVYELAQTALSIRRDYLGEKTYETTKSMIQLAEFYQGWLYYKKAETLLPQGKRSVWCFSFGFTSTSWKPTFIWWIYTIIGKTQPKLVEY